MKRANHISPGFKMFDSGKLKSVISSHMDFLFSTENIRHELDNMEEDFTFLAEAQKAINEKEMPAADRMVYDCESGIVWHSMTVNGVPLMTQEEVDKLNNR